MAVNLDFIGLLVKITGLAAADAINVCAFAVLTMVLVSILTYNPNKPKIVLQAGLYFVAAVFIMYLAYAFILLQLLTTLTEQIRTIGPYVYKGFAVLAMIIGALNIKDYFDYKPGTAGTEMPLSFRPKVKRIIKSVTSPKGAFVTGIFVTLFLLPCTMLPLFVAAGILNDLGYTIITSLPWFLYYNLIFVSPMILIVILIYLGSAKVDDVSGWKERNVKKLHLATGVLLFLVGLSLLLGWL